MSVPPTTDENFPARRDEFLKLIETEFAAPQGADKELVQTWYEKTVEPGGEYYRYYRVFGNDIDHDLVKMAKCFAKSSTGFKENSSKYRLRQIWRLLMQHYAVWDAWHVARILRKYESVRTDLAWWLMRGAAYFFPRLWLAVTAGYVVILGSSDLQGYLQAAAPSPWFRVPLVLLAVFLGMADVQRRVGRRFRTMLLRSFHLLAIGGVAAVAIGIFTAWAGGCAIDEQVWLVRPVTALTLAFVVQLFWQDRSIAEPL